MFQFLIIIWLLLNNCQSKGKCKKVINLDIDAERKLTGDDVGYETIDYYLSTCSLYRWKQAERVCSFVQQLKQRCNEHTISVRTF